MKYGTVRRFPYNPPSPRDAVDTGAFPSERKPHVSPARGLDHDITRRPSARAAIRHNHPETAASYQQPRHQRLGRRCRNNSRRNINHRREPLVHAIHHLRFSEINHHGPADVGLTPNKPGKDQLTNSNHRSAPQCLRRTGSTPPTIGGGRSRAKASSASSIDALGDKQRCQCAPRSTARSPHEAQDRPFRKSRPPTERPPLTGIEIPQRKPVMLAHDRPHKTVGTNNGARQRRCEGCDVPSITFSIGAAAWAASRAWPERWVPTRGFMK